MIYGIKKYVDYNVIYKNGKEEIKREKYLKQDSIIYFVNKLGKITDKVEGMYININKNIDSEEYMYDIMELTDELLDDFFIKNSKYYLH